MSTVLFESWMIHDYGLSLTEAMIYATIFGFSRDGQGCYFGSIRYLMETLDLSESTVKRALKMLKSKGMLREQKALVKNVFVNRYIALRPALPAEKEETCASDSDRVQNEPRVKMNPVQNDTQTGFKMNPDRVQNEPQIIKETKLDNKTPSGARCAHGGGPSPMDVFAEYAKGDKPLLDALKQYNDYRSAQRGDAWNVYAARAVCAKLTKLADEAKATKRTEYMIASIMQSIEGTWSVLEHPKSWGGNRITTRAARGIVDRPEPSGNDFLANAAHRRSLCAKKSRYALAGQG